MTVYRMKRDGTLERVLPERVYDTFTLEYFREFSRYIFEMSEPRVTDEHGQVYTLTEIEKEVLK